MQLLQKVQTLTDAPEGKNKQTCEKMDLNIIQSLLERVQIHKNVGKPNNFLNLSYM